MHSIQFGSRPRIHSFAAVVGEKEGAGPYGRCFDQVIRDPHLGEASWELAESRLQSRTLSLALGKGGLHKNALDCILAGDLIDQCTGSTFAVRGMDVPFLGLYGACSTMAETLLVGAILTDGGYCERVGAVTSSHFSTAERQFRFPLSYGGQRTPTAQWTCTASGAVILSRSGNAPRLAGGCIGRVCDLGVTDATNMGAAMAPAAADTIARYLHDTGTRPEDYDAVVTGDLGHVGTALLLELLEREGIDLHEVHRDCGAMMFDDRRQDTHAGGSGCGCSASLLCGYFLPQLVSGAMHRILFCATGALLSALSAQQGETIPGICHAVEIVSQEMKKGGNAE